LTDLDKAYIEAGAKVGINTIMSSYFEGGNDVSEIRAINPNAEIVAKIESEKGLNYVRTEYNPKSLVRLMAARGDLYVEISRPHLILGAVRDIVEKDPEAIVASRILPSLRNSFLASAQDISDIGFLMEIGYRRFMVGDDICFRKESLLSALNIIQALERDYKPRKK
jgi:pyruvate kinase